MSFTRYESTRRRAAGPTVLTRCPRKFDEPFLTDDIRAEEAEKLQEEAISDFNEVPSIAFINFPENFPDEAREGLNKYEENVLQYRSWASLIWMNTVDKNPDMPKDTSNKSRMERTTYMANVADYHIRKTPWLVMKSDNTQSKHITCKTTEFHTELIRNVLSGFVQTVPTAALNALKGVLESISKSSEATKSDYHTFTVIVQRYEYEKMSKLIRSFLQSTVYGLATEAYEIHSRKKTEQYMDCEITYQEYIAEFSQKDWEYAAEKIEAWKTAAMDDFVDQNEFDVPFEGGASQTQDRPTIDGIVRKQQQVGQDAFKLMTKGGGTNQAVPPTLGSIARKQQDVGQDTLNLVSQGWPAARHNRTHPTVLTRLPREIEEPFLTDDITPEEAEKLQEEAVADFEEVPSIAFINFPEDFPDEAREALNKYEESVLQYRSWASLIWMNTVDKNPDMPKDTSTKSRMKRTTYMARVADYHMRKTPWLVLKSDNPQSKHITCKTSEFHTELITNVLSDFVQTVPTAALNALKGVLESISKSSEATKTDYHTFIVIAERYHYDKMSKSIRSFLQSTVYGLATEAYEIHSRKKSEQYMDCEITYQEYIAEFSQKDWEYAAEKIDAWKKGAMDDFVDQNEFDVPF